MRFLQKLLFISLIMLATASQVRSQPLMAPPGVSEPNQVFITLGLDPELVTTVGYTRLVTQSENNLDFHVGAGLKFAPLILSNEAFRLSIIGAMDWEMNEKWKTRFMSDLYLAHDDNRAGVMNGLGIKLHSSTLYFGERWTKGFKLGWQYTGLTHIRHSAETKDTFRDRYPDNITGVDGPKDGWYKSTASRFRLGFISSIKMEDSWNLQLEIGTQFAIQKQGILLGFSHAQVPIYLKSTVSYQY